MNFLCFPGVDVVCVTKVTSVTRRLVCSAQEAPQRGFTTAKATFSLPRLSFIPRHATRCLAVVTHQTTCQVDGLYPNNLLMRLPFSLTTSASDRSADLTRNFATSRARQDPLNGPPRMSPNGQYVRKSVRVLNVKHIGFCGRAV